MVRSKKRKKVIYTDKRMTLTSGLIFSKVYVIRTGKERYEDAKDLWGYGVKEYLSYDDVINSVETLHPREEDFNDGDLILRISQYEWYNLEEIEINKIKYDNFDYNEAQVKKLFHSFKNGEEYPPIVYDPVNQTLIDGVHRVRALKLIGLKKIKAYVGDVETYNDQNDWEILSRRELFYLVKFGENVPEIIRLDSSEGYWKVKFRDNKNFRKTRELKNIATDIIDFPGANINLGLLGDRWIIQEILIPKKTQYYNNYDSLKERHINKERASNLAIEVFHYALKEKIEKKVKLL